MICSIGGHRFYDVVYILRKISIQHSPHVERITHYDHWTEIRFFDTRQAAIFAKSAHKNNVHITEFAQGVSGMISASTRKNVKISTALMKEIVTQHVGDVDTVRGITPNKHYVTFFDNRNVSKALSQKFVVDDRVQGVLFFFCLV